MVAKSKYLPYSEVRPAMVKRLQLLMRKQIREDAEREKRRPRKIQSQPTETVFVGFKAIRSKS